MTIKTLTEILGLSLELKDYEDRVQKRYDYIQEQLELDPEFVACDYFEYWLGTNDIHLIIKQMIISTEGVIYTLQNDVWAPSMLTTKTSKEYYRKKFVVQGKRKAFQVHRAVASTFIPKPKTLAPYNYKDLFINHKNGNKVDNHLANLEWCTPKQNLCHAIETQLLIYKRGSDHFKTTPILGRVLVPGKYHSMMFVIAADRGLETHGFNISNVIVQMKNKTSHAYGCAWKKITKEELDGYKLGFPEGYVDYIKQNPYLLDFKIKPALATVMVGPFKNKMFCLFGKRQIEQHGLCDVRVSEGCLKNKVYYNCKWKRITFKESLNHTMGFPQDVLDTLTTGVLNVHS